MPPIMVVSTWTYVMAFAVGVVMVWRYRPDTAYEAIVLFLGISVLATAVQYLFRSLGLNNWFVEYAYPLPQILLCGIAMGVPVRTVTEVGALLTVGTMAILLRGAVTVPENVVQGMGGAWLGWTALESPMARPDLLRAALLLYWGLTLPLVLLMPLAFEQSNAFLGNWIQTLHALRIMAVLALLTWLWRERRST